MLIPSPLYSAPAPHMGPWESNGRWSVPHMGGIHVRGCGTTPPHTGGDEADAVVDVDEHLDHTGQEVPCGGAHTPTAPGGCRRGRPGGTPAE